MFPRVIISIMKHNFGSKKIAVRALCKLYAMIPIVSPYSLYCSHRGFLCSGCRLFACLSSFVALHGWGVVEGGGFSILRDGGDFICWVIVVSDAICLVYLMGLLLL